MAKRLQMFLLGGVATLLGCAAGDAPRGEGEVVVRDSAGIRIVKNPWALDEAPAVWRISDEPVLEVGVLDGPEEYQLHQVAGALRLDDGRIVVANGGTGEVRFYGPDGRFLSGSGGRGEGPGEYAGLSGVWRYRADSLLAWDSRLRRVSVLNASGEHVRTAIPENSASTALLVGSLVDGSIVTREFDLDWSDAPRRVRDALVRYAADGARLGSLGRYGSITLVTIEVGGTVAMGNVIFDAGSTAAAAPSALYAGTTRDASVDVRSIDGDLTARIRWREEPRPVTQRHIDGYRERMMARAETDADRQIVDAYVRATPFADNLPAHSQLRVDSAGHLWVRHYDPTLDPVEERWTVFDSEGVMQAVVTLPAHFSLLEAGADYVLGTYRDALGVAYVRMYALDRAGSI